MRVFVVILMFALAGLAAVYKLGGDRALTTVQQRMDFSLITKLGTEPRIYVDRGNLIVGKDKGFAAIYVSYATPQLIDGTTYNGALFAVTVNCSAQTGALNSVTLIDRSAGGRRITEGSAALQIGRRISDQLEILAIARRLACS